MRLLFLAATTQNLDVIQESRRSQKLGAFLATTLALLALAPQSANASLPKAASFGHEPIAASLQRTLEPSELAPMSTFALFAGDELASEGAMRALDLGALELASRSRDERFHALHGISLLNDEPLRGPPESLSETRIRVFEVLGEKVIGVERGLSLELHWGWGSGSAEEASGSRELRIFDPQGNPRTVSAYGWNRLFQGREWHPILNAYDFRNRMLIPEMGRWNSEDPIGFQDSANLYQFAGDSFFNTDPLGLCLGIGDAPCSAWADAIDEMLGRRFSAARGGGASLMKTLVSPATMMLRTGESTGAFAYRAGQALFGSPQDFIRFAAGRQAVKEGVKEFGGSVGDVVAIAGPLAALEGKAPALLQSPVLEAGGTPIAKATLALPAGKARLALPAGTLDSAIATNYQRYIDEAAAEVIKQFNRGSISIPEGMPWQTVIGQRIDAAARARLRRFLGREGIAEGPGMDVLVNRRLNDPTGSGLYRIPDLKLDRSRRILDLTIGEKPPGTPQLRDFEDFSGGFDVEVLRPQTGPLSRPR